MQILNVHSRIYPISKDHIVELLTTLSSPSDMVWPKEKWPKMRLNNGLFAGSKGGHGPIKYTVESNLSDNQIVFRFTRPRGFNGVHKFNINVIEANKTELVHTIDMEVNILYLFLWWSSIKWLHDALIDDGLDKIYNQITNHTKETKWNLWVRILRTILKLDTNHFIRIKRLHKKTS